MIRTDDKAGAIERCAANIAAVLRHYGLPEVTVIAARPDRIIASVPDRFFNKLDRISMRPDEKFSAWRFIDNHGTTATDGWREACASFSTQIIRHVAEDGTETIEADIDYWNPNHGAAPGLIHGFEVLINKLWKRKTDPWRIAEGLKKRGIEVSGFESSRA